MVSRQQKRWAGRLRTGGALLLLFGAVGLIDRLLRLLVPVRAADPLATSPSALELGGALGALALGAALFSLGNRWR